MAINTPSYPFKPRGGASFVKPVTSRASKVNTRDMGRGRVPKDRVAEAKKGRRV